MSHPACIDVDAALVLMAARPAPLLLDMRAEADFRLAHDRRSLALNTVNLRALLKDTDKERPVIVCCYHGNASRDMARLFADFGFRHCYSLDGGFAAWRTRNSAWLRLAEQAPDRHPGLFWGSAPL